MAATSVFLSPLFHIDAIAAEQYLLANLGDIKNSASKTMSAVA
jgi:hypothetical protein